MIIKPEHYKYLYTQHGRVSHVTGHFERWKEAYLASLDRIYTTIRPHLLPACGGILDIGSGLGGIDILLSRHYAGAPQVYLLDGDSKTTEVVFANEPHNDMDVARDFQRANGVRATTVTPDNTDLIPTQGITLAVSFAAFAFHIRPTVYRSLVARALEPGGMAILEVRKREGWRGMLDDVLGEGFVIHSTNKADWVVYRGQEAQPQ